MSLRDIRKDDTDKLLLANEPDTAAAAVKARAWKVLVVDDDKEVHAVTNLALDGFEFAGRPLQLLGAFSAAEGREILAAHRDIAVVLLDVVMETDHAGLDLVRFIREELRNRFIRIVLRTGQPGQAPEHKVITDYDINDYKEKTELTRQKLFTTVYTSLSSYRDLVALDRNRHGLVMVIEASAKIFEQRSVEHFAQGVLEQLTALLYLDQDAMIITASSLAADQKNDLFEVVAATGSYTSLVGRDIQSSLGEPMLARVSTALSKKASHWGVDYYVGYYQTESGLEHVLYVSANTPLSVPDMSLIEMFSRNVAIAHETARLLSSASAPDSK